MRLCSVATPKRLSRVWITLYVSGSEPLSSGDIHFSITSQLPRLNPFKRTTLPLALTILRPLAWSRLSPDGGAVGPRVGLGVGMGVGVGVGVGTTFSAKDCEALPAHVDCCSCTPSVVDADGTVRHLLLF